MGIISNSIRDNIRDGDAVVSSFNGSGFLYNVVSQAALATDVMGIGPDDARSVADIDITTNPNWATADGAGGVYQVLGDSDLESILRLDNGSQQVLLGVDILEPTAISGIGFVMSYGRTTTTVGGYGLVLLGDGRMRLDQRSVGDSGTNGILTSVGASVDARVHYLFDVNVATNSCTIFKNGSPNAAADGTVTDFDNPQVGAEATGGLCLLCRMGSAGVADKPQTNTQIANIFAFKPAVNSLTLAADVAAELYEYPYEIPESLTGK